MRESSDLLEILEQDGYLVVHHGLLAEGHDGAWLTDEADDPTIRLRHLTNLGRSLAKASIGRPLTRDQAQQVLAQAMERIEALSIDSSCTHELRRVLLCGSLLSPSSDDARRDVIWPPSADLGPKEQAS